MITKAYLLHVVDGLVEDVERPVRRGERREDGATQLQAARPDLQRALKHLHSVVVLALKLFIICCLLRYVYFTIAYLCEQLLADDTDDDEGTLVEFHHLELAVCGLQGSCWEKE